MNRTALAAVIVLLIVPAPADAQWGGPFPQQTSEDYGPGITVSGAGFAPRHQRARATARAIADARLRAESVASAMSVSLGEIRAVETRTPFEPRRDCEPNEESRRCAALEAVSAEVTFAIQGGPTSDEGAREISGSGTAVAPVANERKTSPSIRGSLRQARRAATPDAANIARANAEAAATASGLGLGQLFSIVEQSNPYGYDPLLGAYGPGDFCARTRRARLVRDPDTGERHVVRGKRVLRCFRPRNVPVSFEVTYLGA
jgi:hypothetical protein